MCVGKRSKCRASTQERSEDVAHMEKIRINDNRGNCTSAKIPIFEGNNRVDPRIPMEDGKRRPEEETARRGTWEIAVNEKSGNKKNLAEPQAPQQRITPDTGRQKN